MYMKGACHLAFLLTEAMNVRAVIVFAVRIENLIINIYFKITMCLVNQ